MPCTIPFGPTADPLGLATDDFEFISLEGPQHNVENEHMTLKKDGRFLRFAGTRDIRTYTANYIILDADAELPEVGLHTYSGSNYWIRSVNRSEPQENDQTLAVTFVVPGDIANCEALRSDFSLA